MRSHERQVDMDVRVDEPGEHKLFRRIDLFSIGGNGKVHSDLADLLVLAIDVSHIVIVGSNDASVSNDNSHDNFPQLESSVLKWVRSYVSQKRHPSACERAGLPISNCFVQTRATYSKNLRVKLEHFVY